MTSKAIDIVAPRITELLIRKIESLETKWEKPWIAPPENGLPRNIRGTVYKGSNLMLLGIHAAMENYRSPIYLTAEQAQKEGVKIKPGEDFFPVTFFMPLVIHKTRSRVSPETYKQLSRTDRKDYSVFPLLRYYQVYNIDQTDFATIQPEKYKELTGLPKIESVTNGYQHEPLDRLINQQLWCCAIECRYSNQSFYNPSIDKIVCPKKEQFPKGDRFYDTLLHEMAHSTGHPARLNRIKHKAFGDKDYAREELVAELSAALAGYMLGISTTPQNDNAAYIKHWLFKLQEGPKFLFDTLSDVHKAVKMIMDFINRPI